MKRSEINALIKDAILFLAEMKFNLPEFAFWTPENWQLKGNEADEIRDCMLGWDITDFGEADFYKVGLFLFTLRNGNLNDPDNKKTYAEKIMIVREGQVTPCHFHWQKMEDIINRGGGNLMIQLYPATEDEKLGQNDLTVSIDGVSHTIRAGTIVRLKPGQSITLLPWQYHSFWAENGCGRVMTGEVSQVNDDNNDNRFLEKQPRFSAIEEDEKPLYLLANEYLPAK